MNKARNRFILLTELIVILLLGLLLTVINVLNFTMAADDADFLTERIAREHGMFEEKKQNGQTQTAENRTTASGAHAETQNNNDKPFRLDNGHFRFMGQDSPEMKSSLLADFGITSIRAIPQSARKLFFELLERSL